MSNVSKYSIAYTVELVDCLLYELCGELISG